MPTKYEEDQLKTVRPTIPSNALLLAVVALMLSAFTVEARGSTYEVHECRAGATGVADANLEGGANGYVNFNSCGGPSVNQLQVGSSAAVAPGGFRSHAFTAPAGTRMNNIQGTYGLMGTSDDGGHQGYVFVRRASGGNDIVVDHTRNGGGFSGAFFDIASSIGGGPFNRFGIGMGCTHSAAQGNCPSRSGIYAQAGEYEFSMQDTVAPSPPQIFGSAFDGWVRGTKDISFNVHDTGAGASLTATVVNGNMVDFDSVCNAAIDSTGAATRMKPCPSDASASTTVDVSSAPFQQGNNAVVVCLNEYGESAQVGCDIATIKVDTVAPGGANGIDVEGGQDWHRDNDFDLTWSNPPQGPNEAPIVGATLRITGPDNYDRSTYYAGADRNAITNIDLPGKGAYTAVIYLRDAAGNETHAIQAVSRTVSLRYDDTIPEPQAPNIANGWISRSELGDGYLQGWDPVDPDLAPPSGIIGYRVVVNTNSDTDPCSGAVDPRTCGAPITEFGQGNLNRTLEPGDLAEGANFVHVVPVSGSGMRATVVKHTPLKADFTDPVTSLQGDGDGEWINHDADLTAAASDALSGMQDTAEFPDDDPPATYLQVDGQIASDVDAHVSTSLSSEGEHRVMFWARDLAGNEPGVPDMAIVRIDKTAPSVAFTNSQDPDDPDKVVAPVSDGLSGVIDGRISYRQEGGQQWKALNTIVHDGELASRVDSVDMQPGVTYEFRAEATDKAGNTATSTSKQNGQPMKVIGPFRALTSVVDLKVNGKNKARIPYDKKARVSGELVTDQGEDGVANASVELVQSYAEGSQKKTVTKNVTTDREGGFSATLPRGPSRTIVARFAGDLRYLGTSSAKAKVGVKSKVSLKVNPKAHAGGTTSFRGKVKTKGAKLAKSGKRLEIQVRIGKKWKTVGRSIRTNTKGAYMLTYKFTAHYTEPVKYQFRAAVLRERGFPYLPSTSKKRSVTVSP